MLFNFLTIFPDLINQSLNFGVIGQAIKNKHICYQVINLRDFTEDKHRSVDDRPFGGNDGMLMKPEVLSQALQSVSHTKILFPSPRGVVLTQKKAAELAKNTELSFLCGRYAGIDERVIIHHNIEEISIGDYVVSGGELPALVIMDAIARHRPFVLGNDVSVATDSFSQGILEGPSFTRPQVWNDLKVPDILVGGDHAKIKNLNTWLAIFTTLKKRPELLKKSTLDPAIVSLISNKSKVVAAYNALSIEDKKSCGLENLEILFNEMS